MSTVHKSTMSIQKIFSSLLLNDGLEYSDNMAKPPWNIASTEHDLSVRRNDWGFSDLIAVRIR